MNNEDFNKYKYTQTKDFHSMESDNSHWKQGQERYLNLNFQSVDKEKSILDMACGDGVGLTWFKDNKFKNVVGIEFDEVKREHAKKTGYTIHDMDMHDLKLDNNSFDIVYSSHTIEHAHSPSQVFKEIFRILKDDGLAYIVLPYFDHGHDDCHIGKWELGTTIRDEAKTLCAFIESCNFTVEHMVFDNFRQEEVWLVLSKTIMKKDKDSENV